VLITILHVYTITLSLLHSACNLPYVAKILYCSHHTNNWYAHCNNRVSGITILVWYLSYYIHFDCAPFGHYKYVYSTKWPMQTVQPRCMAVCGSHLCSLRTQYPTQNLCVSTILQGAWQYVAAIIVHYVPSTQPKTCVCLLFCKSTQPTSYMRCREEGLYYSFTCGYAPTLILAWSCRILANHQSDPGLYCSGHHHATTTTMQLLLLPNKFITSK
jgi:hypothetical protein